MAKKKSKVPFKKRADLPARWYQDLKPEQRESQLIYMRSTVKLLRQFVTGFDAKDGYDLRHPERMSFQKFDQIRKYGQQYHALTSSPNYRAVARTAKEHEVLRKYTGQALKSKTHTNKAYVVHHAEAAYRDIKIKVNKQGRVTLTKKTPGLTQRSQIFMFADYGYNPRAFVSIDNVKEATQAMIDSGDMPEEGHYQLETELHGPVWYTMNRDDIVLNLESTIRDSSAKSPSFARSLLGWRYYVDEIEAEIKANALKEERRRQKDLSKKYRHVHQARALFGKWSEQYYDEVLKKKAKKKLKKAKR